ncbi:MAG: M23 family metallopeptidase [Daejeonella sp.]
MIKYSFTAFHQDLIPKDLWKFVLSLVLIYFPIGCNKDPFIINAKEYYGKFIFPLNFKKIDEVIKNNDILSDDETGVLNNYIWPYNVKGGGHPLGHPGIDLAGPDSCEVFAVYDGEITRVAPYDNTESGTSVILRIVNGFNVSYQNLSIATVSVGESVKKGQVIGYLYHTSNSYGNSIHFDVKFSHGTAPDSPDCADPRAADVRCPYPFFDDEAKQNLNYLITKTTCFNPGYCDDNGNYAQVCY